MVGVRRREAGGGRPEGGWDRADWWRAEWRADGRIRQRAEEIAEAAQGERGALDRRVRRSGSDYWGTG